MCKKAPPLTPAHQYLYHVTEFTDLEAALFKKGTSLNTVVEMISVAA
jgi:hypothetical protein